MLLIYKNMWGKDIKTLTEEWEAKLKNDWLWLLPEEIIWEECNKIKIIKNIIYWKN